MDGELGCPRALWSSLPLKLRGEGVRGLVEIRLRSQICPLLCRVRGGGSARGSKLLFGEFLVCEHSICYVLLVHIVLHPFESELHVCLFWTPQVCTLYEGALQKVSTEYLNGHAFLFLGKTDGLLSWFSLLTIISLDSAIPNLNAAISA